MNELLYREDDGNFFSVHNNPKKRLDTEVGVNGINVKDALKLLDYSKDGFVYYIYSSAQDVQDVVASFKDAVDKVGYSGNDMVIYAYGNSNDYSDVIFRARINPKDPEKVRSMLDVIPYLQRDYTHAVEFNPDRYGVGIDGGVYFAYTDGTLKDVLDALPNKKKEMSKIGRVTIIKNDHFTLENAVANFDFENRSVSIRAPSSDVIDKIREDIELFRRRRGLNTITLLSDIGEVPGYTKQGKLLINLRNNNRIELEPYTGEPYISKFFGKNPRAINSLKLLPGDVVVNLTHSMINEMCFS